MSKFVRRSYLSKHLMLKHGFNKLDAHSTACQAPRGDIQPEEYYDDVSDDDTILDLIEEMDQEQYEQHYMDSISNFKIPDLNNNDVSTSSVNIRNEEMASDKNSFQVIMCDQYSDISSISNSDQKSDNDKMSSELDYFDENVYYSDDSPVVAVNGDEADKLNDGDEADELREGDEADELNEGAEADELREGDEADELNEGAEADELREGDEADELNEGAEADELCEGDEADELREGDEVDELNEGDEADELSEGDEADEFGNSDSEDDIIIIDSDDEYAIVPSNMHQRIQTFVYTIRRDTTYIGGRQIDVKTYAERNYYERWN